MDGGSGIYILTSRMMGQVKSMNIVADNVANANTTGYKRQEMSFREIEGGKKLHPAGRFTTDLPLRYVFTNGGLEKTDNPLDVALEGDGFFAIQGPNGGEIKYTRDGQFGLDAAGNLVTSRGERVLDSNNAPINIPEGAQIVIAKDGSIGTREGLLAQLGIFTFADNQQLVRAGGSVYINPQRVVATPATPENVTVKQGFMESSNVNPIEETVNMTEALRSYQSTLRSLNTLEDLENRAIRELARVSQ